jgi:gamma-glutamylcyclotransferase (GGCT)/AIG2-like uncharacterized protein YtfP
VSVTGDRLCFAYGSNMDEEQMRDRCPDATAVRTARLLSYLFIINSRGVATVVPAGSSTVHGVLWRITAECEARLDRYEGVKWGTYTKETLGVKAEDGQAIEALVYVARDSEPGEGRDGYVERIVAAAEHQGLPASYIEELRSWIRA